MNLGAWQRGRKGSGGLGRMDLHHARRRRAWVVHGACEQQQTESFKGNPALGGLGSLFPKRFVEQPQGLNHAPALRCAQRRQPCAKGSGQEQQGDATALQGARCGKGKGKNLPENGNFQVPRAPSGCRSPSGPARAGLNCASPPSSRCPHSY